MNKEIWKAIPGYEGHYEVSDLGRVRSVDKEVDNGKGRYFKKGRVLKQSISNKGRPVVSLCKNRKKYTKHTHSLVALAFIGERPEGYDVCHIDGNVLNNKLSNIRFDTRSQNQIDIYRYGNKSSSGKLSVDKVLEIRRLYSTGNYKQIELAKKFNVGQDNISLIVNRKTFTWLNDDGTIDESHTTVSKDL
ncbi:NUMOD4 motif-containing HNH endonuclease [Mammaliicoccus sciuri]|uniref:NUMOD4 motif-containing HNH endonuclease n=1 Tax=Mammaliicoccus sciuri TaxID=1296 RepID=UPI001951CF2D|nr:NUMOD4 motif-containing HNH endonuclease [Mammaliicoccus sciuri]